MKANELRIGNHIQDINFPERECRVFRLTSGTDFSIAYSYNKVYENSYANDRMDNLRPIPLTEEWVLKFGFESNGLYCIGKEVIYPDRVHWFNIDYKSTDRKYFYNGWEFQYVHQLQNLYFALTGEELTIYP